VDSESFDVVVIGGGPGGSATATYLAREGFRVLVLEKDRFPRFHIGESLLPYNQTIFQEMGVWPELEKEDFPQKFGAQFLLGNGSKANTFIFSEGRFTREPMTIQVERARFDHILLNHAKKCGAEVREGWIAQRFEDQHERIQVDVRDVKCENRKCFGSFLVDASGRGNLTGNQEQIRLVHSQLKKLAVFGHFEGVRLDEGERKGDTVIVRLKNKWFWLIPISSRKVSVGCVLDREEFSAQNVEPEALFKHIVDSSAPLRERMQSARLIGSIQTTTDFSYHNRRFVGHRLLRVGDAAGFIDPIFSSGVYLAMYSGKLAARAVTEALKRGNDGSIYLAAYETKFNRAMQVYWQMVENFYTTPFMELFLEPRRFLHLPSAVNAVLAGELEGGWRLRWRLKLFFLLVKLQRYRPFVPRICFD